MTNKELEFTFTEGELETITNAEGQLVMKMNGLDGIDESEAQERLTEIERERDKIIADTTRDALARHISEIDHSPTAIFNKTASIIDTMLTFGAQDLDEAIKADPSGEAATILIKKTLQHQFESLEGETNAKGELMTQQLDFIIVEKIKKRQGEPLDIRGVLNLIEKNKTVKQLSTIRMASDAVTKEIFDNAIKTGDKPVVISRRNDPVLVYATVQGGNLRQGDRVIFDTLSSLYDAGYEFVDLQTLHNTMTNEGNYKRMTETDREYYKRRINTMRRIDIKIDITDALTRFKDLHELPTITRQEEKWNFEDRTSSNTDYLLPVAHAENKLAGFDGYIFRGRPWTYSFAEKLKQLSIIGLNVLRVTGKITAIHWDLFAYLHDRVRQANTSWAGDNDRTITCSAIYKKVGATGHRKQTCRKTTERILDSFKAQGFIYDYNITTKGRAIYSYNLLKPPARHIDETSSMNVESTK